MSHLTHLPPDSDHRKDTASAIPAKPPGVITFPIASFDEAYPPDPFGEEAAEHARVWKVYRDQATEHDKKQLDGWNKTLDILLIFAGLYSAVLTAFLIESYHMLSEDSTDYMAKLLFQVVSANNGSLSLPVLQPVTGPIQPPGANFTLSTNALWINGLWFSSLALTLSVALLCILAKEWLTEYEGVVFARAPTAHYWTRRRELHHKGMKKWGVPFLISSLPSLLHVALFLFIVGLYLFLLPLDRGISIAVGAVGGTVLVFYLLHFIIPIWNTSCAFRSPLARHIRRASTEVWHRVLVLGSTLYSAVSYGRAAVKETPSSSALSREQSTINARYALLDARALHWLLSSSTRSVASAAIQAIGSIRPASDTAERLRTLNIQSTVDGYMDTRTLELTERNILHNDAALAEHMHCVRAMLSVAGAAPVHGATPFMELQHDLRNRDAQLLNRIVYIFRSRATTASTPSADIELISLPTLKPETMLLRALEDLNSEQRDPSTQTQPACHPSTLLLLFDILQIRLDRVHGTDKGLEEELGETRADTLDRRQLKFRAVAIHCETVIHLVHALSPIDLDDNESLSVSMYLGRCSDALSGTTVPGIALLPPKHAYHSGSHGNGTEIQSRFLLFAHWVFLANHSKELLFSSQTEDVLARDIAAMSPIIAPAFRSSDLHNLFAPCRHGGNHLEIEDPRTRRTLALLINHHAELDPNSSGLFTKFFSSEGALAFSQRNFNENLDDILCFLERSNDQPCAWEILHNTICAGGRVNIYVVQLAVALAAALRTRLLERTPAVGIEDQVDVFFAAPFLGPCLRALCRDYLELASHSSPSPSRLQGRLKVAFNLLADCAFISADRTAQQMRMEVLIDRPRDGERDSGTLPSTTLTAYIGWVREQDPRETQCITMRIFQGIPELVLATRLSQLDGPPASGTATELPCAALEAFCGWDFWSSCGLSRHQEILTTSRSLARRILESETQTSTVQVPPALLSVIAELCSQGLTSLELRSDEPLDDELVAEYLAGLGAYKRFSYDRVEGRMSDWAESALLDMQNALLSMES